MNQETIDKMIQLRSDLIQTYERTRDYKTNKNALMKEVDHARVIHETITKIDKILGDHVSFS